MISVENSKSPPVDPEASARLLRELQDLSQTKGKSATVPFMEIYCIPYDLEKEADDCALDWEAGISEDGKEILINNKFKSPPKVSQSDSNDSLVIKFWGAPELRSKTGKQLFAYAQIKIISLPE
jgi:hypothetical protein